ncbi:amidase domain-containing protein [Nocardioides sp. zg-ZUI104]|nr:amidase domain-containing protein [Nocardioides faecalis]
MKYALKPNKDYRTWSYDCTNFVSQAMRAGGWKEVSHPWVDYKWDDACGGTAASQPRRGRGRLPRTSTR